MLTRHFFGSLWHRRGSDCGRVASVAPRNLSVSERGFLGVGMENSPDGVKVTMVQMDQS